MHRRVVAVRVLSKLRREGHERGAAMVEMAIVAHLLVLLVFGTIEFGLLFQEKLTIASATASAARTGATMGTRDEADFAILQALEAGLYDQVDTSVLIRVDIFKANPVTGVKAGPVDRYTYIPTNVGCKWSPCPDTSLDGPVGSWLPADRDTVLEPSGGGLDVLGVEIEYRHTSATSIIPGIDRTFTERALVRLEPDVFGTSSG